MQTNESVIGHHFGIRSISCKNLLLKGMTGVLENLILPSISHFNTKLPSQINYVTLLMNRWIISLHL